MNYLVKVSSYSLLKWFALLAKYFLWCPAVTIFCKWFVHKTPPRILTPKPPSLKIPFYSIFGHLRFLPSASVLKKTSLPIQTYAVHILGGQAALFREFPLFKMYYGLRPALVLTRQETVKELLSSNTMLRKSVVYDMSHDFIGTGLLTSYGSKWKSRRKLLTQSFHADILKTFVPTFVEQSGILVDILKTKIDEDWINIIPPITLCSLDIICETMLGAHVGAQTDRKSEYVAAVLRLTETLTERVVNPILHPDILFRLSKLGRQWRRDLDCLHNFTRKIIREKKMALKSKISQCQERASEENNFHVKTRRKAFMDLLLDVHLNNQKEFTEEDIREEVDTFVFEGHDTTSTGMCWALYLIGLYPHVQAKVYQELVEIFGEDRERFATLEDLKDMKYLERVIKESLRLYPPVSLFARQHDEDYSIGGYRIKKSVECAVYAYELHRNPDVFPDPEKFDPDRFLPENVVSRNPFAYVPFSAGPRNCIGQRFALMEEKVVISDVLRNFHIKSLEPRDAVHPMISVILRSDGPLKLKLILRNPTSTAS